ncbi:acid protease [Russula earlei]|uniref:Acid protease n=1 Tax=Russula earlei TaxID=71964 RepID=A0ACC0UAY1_9AGAM|nr:acid protease [Russula earlei]
MRLDLRGLSIYPQHHKRSHISGLDNAQDLQYFTNISLGGEPFLVSIDTGSSDLWVAGIVPNSNDTGVSASIQYAIGGVSGSVMTASLNFLDFNVSDQAYIQVQSSSAYPERQGLLGLGPNVGSNIHVALKNQPTGDTVLDRIFRQDPSTPNALTILLSRSDDPGKTYPGQITVSDIVPGLESILAQPKLPVKAVPSTQSGDQHWQALLDPNGIIGPDGQRIAMSTKVAGAPIPSQLTVVFDTGFSFSQVPKYVADAIYSRISGAQFQNLTTTGPIWTLPCNAEVNTTLIFGNISLPIHPLDTSFNLQGPTGNQFCVGGFQPITTGAAPDYDMILGMTFLRNVYLLVNYGDFVDGTATKAPPYVQLLSVTDPAAAHVDFVNTRLGGVDTTGFQVLINSSPSSSDSDYNGSDQQTRLIVIGGVASGCLLILLIAIVAYITLRRRHRRRRDTLLIHGAGPAPMLHSRAGTTDKPAELSEVDNSVPPPRYKERNSW